MNKPFVPRSFRWRARTRIAIAWHWLREQPGNILGGETGRRVRTPVIAEVEIRTMGRFRSTITREEPEWLRLRIEAAGKPAEDLLASARIISISGLPRTGDVDPLLAALLGAGEYSGEVARGLACFSGYQALSVARRRRLEHWFGRVNSEAEFERLRCDLEQVCAFRDRLYHEALRALERKCPVTEARRLCEAECDSVLLDCSVPLNETGLAACREAVGGELTHAIETARTEGKAWGGLTAGLLEEETVIELHLPLVEKKRWSDPVALVAGSACEAGDDGRVVVYPARETHPTRYINHHQTALVLAGTLPLFQKTLDGGGSFRISFSDCRVVPLAYARHALPPLLDAYGFSEAARRILDSAPFPCRDVEVALTLFVPASAGRAWLDLPPERTAGHYTIFSWASVAVQAALRGWLPWVHFSDPGNFAATGAAYPLLVYQASRPFHRRTRADFTYDPLHAASLNLALRNATGALPEILGRARDTLLERGSEKLAGRYSPALTGRIMGWMKPGNRHFQGLLAADALLVEQLTKLGNLGRSLSLATEKDPARTTRFLLRSTGQVLKPVHARLRRLYCARDRTSFGSLILLVATSALSGAPIGAVLRLRPVSDANVPEYVFVNTQRNAASRESV